MVEKVHCVWISDGEMNVLFESKSSSEADATENLKTAHIQSVTNKEMVMEYLAKMEYIPHIQTVITMEPASAVQTCLTGN